MITTLRPIGLISLAFACTFAPFASAEAGQTKSATATATSTSTSSKDDQTKEKPQVRVRVPIDASNAWYSQQERMYERARDLIEDGRYENAVAQLDQFIARVGQQATDNIAPQVDAALYWKAYSQGKMRDFSEAMRTIEDMTRRFSSSRWLKDAQALELEFKQSSGQAVSPDAQPDEDLKLLALRGLMQSDPDRAVPMIEQVLAGNNSVRVKENALFVLSQSRTARARDIIGSVAKGGANPELQLRAIRYVGAMRGPDSGRILEEAYRASTDQAVKRAIIRSLMVSGDRARLGAIASDTGDSQLRGEAIRQLGVLHGDEELVRLYGRESAPELKRSVISALFVSGNAARLVELARAEKDMTLKRDIVQKLSLMRSKEATDYLLEVLK